MEEVIAKEGSTITVDKIIKMEVLIRYNKLNIAIRMNQKQDY